MQKKGKSASGYWGRINCFSSKVRDEMQGNFCVPAFCEYSSVALVVLLRQYPKTIAS